MAGTSIKILGIGNTYTRNCMRWLWKILKEAGYNTVTVGYGIAVNSSSVTTLRALYRAAIDDYIARNK